MNTYRTPCARPTLRSLAGLSLVAAVLGLGSAPASAACTVLDQPPGQMIAPFAPFDGQINPGNPDGLDQPVVPALCRPDAP
jgi:hypothetical protein